MKTSKFILIFIASILVSCSGNKITLNNSYFATYDDPIYSTTFKVMIGFETYDTKYNDPLSAFTPSLLTRGIDSTFSIRLHLDNKKHEMPQSVEVFNTTDNKLVYTRELELDTGNIYKSSFSAYYSNGNCCVDFSGKFEITIAIDSSEIDDYMKDPKDDVGDYLVQGGLYHYELLNGCLKSYSDSGVLSKVVNISDDIVQEIEYWPNGKEKLVKTFDREQEELLDVFNYNENGDSGIPMECALIRNNGWMVFQSNMYDCYGQRYLIIIPTPKDWHVGAAVFVSSEDFIKSTYKINDFGKYQLSEDGSKIQFFSMANTNYYEDNWEMSVSWNNIPNDIEISGLYHNLTSNFAYTPSVTKNASVLLNTSTFMWNYVYFS